MDRITRKRKIEKLNNTTAHSPKTESLVNHRSTRLVFLYISVGFLLNISRSHCHTSNMSIIH